MKKYNIILSIILISFFGLSSASTLAKSNKDGLKFKVLENISNEECSYSGQVAVETKYKLKHFNSDFGLLVLETSQDGVNYVQAQSEEVEAGRGSKIIPFDAGECTLDIRLSIQ